MYCCDKKMDTVRTVRLEDTVIRDRFCNVCRKLVKTQEIKFKQQETKANTKSNNIPV